MNALQERLNAVKNDTLRLGNWAIFQINKELKKCIDKEHEKGYCTLIHLYEELAINTGIDLKNIIKIAECNKPITSNEYFHICKYIGFDLIDRMYSNLK